MAEIVPFYGVLPAKEYASRVAALPYDVYSREEAAAVAAKDRLSFLNIDRPETQFDPSQDMYAPEVYRRADEMLHAEIAEGIFVQDPQKNYYIYELTMNGRSQTGLVACASIDDYMHNVIKKHENTRAEKEEDRVRHVDACSAQTGPIFLTYHREDRIAAVIARAKEREPLFAFLSDDGIGHRGWRIDETSDIIEICEAFAGIDRIYIADGHHRAASAVRVGLQRRAEHPDYEGNEEFHYFLSVLFPADELMIMDYNRLVKDLNGLSVQEFLTRTGEVFAISPCEAEKKPDKKGSITMYLDSKWYHLELKSKYRSTDPVLGLDVSALQTHLIGPVLDIQDPKRNRRIDFVGGIRGLGELKRRVDEDGWAVAFAMYPTSIEELFAVADAGLLMPPKSTWFEPKLRSGLFLHLFER
ncbi:MAG: DUF1015 family protein [Lachnospiraceae bacterium]|nr:DUF1015 family protein [Lachnospiraceae bacterium]